MAKRVTKMAALLVTIDQFNDAMADYALASAKGNKIKAQMEQEIVKIREKYAQPIEETAAVMVDSLGIIEDYCKENKDVLFAHKRSMEHMHGVVGYRRGTPKLKLLPKYKWDMVLDKVKVVLPEYVRRYEEVDKDGLIDAREDEKVAPYLNQVGVYVDQDERFFIQLKSEEVPE